MLSKVEEKLLEGLQKWLEYYPDGDIEKLLQVQAIVLAQSYTLLEKSDAPQSDYSQAVESV